MSVRKMALLASVTPLVMGVATAADDASGASKSLLADTNLWVLVAFAIVVGIIFFAGVPGKIAEFFRARADGVRTQLDEARTLREDAQKLLADYQKRQREAETEAQAIIDQAKADAKIMADDARVKIEEQVKRRNKAAEDRIARAEAQAVAAMRGQTSDMAIAAAKHIIANRVDDRAQASLLDKAISEVRGRLN